MPSYKCNWPSCDALLPARGMCALHAPRAARERDRAHEASRNRVLYAFYRGRPWMNLSRLTLTSNPICQRCGREPSREAHHTLKLATREGWAERLNPELVLAVCRPCHRRLDAQAKAATG